MMQIMMEAVAAFVVLPAECGSITSVRYEACFIL
jgi:hypothetical protein